MKNCFELYKKKIFLSLLLESEDGSFVENILTVIESFMKYPRLTHVVSNDTYF